MRSAAQTELTPSKRNSGKCGLRRPAAGCSIHSWYYSIAHAGEPKMKINAGLRGLLDAYSLASGEQIFSDRSKRHEFALWGPRDRSNSDDGRTQGGAEPVGTRLESRDPACSRPPPIHQRLRVRAGGARLDHQSIARLVLQAVRRTVIALKVTPCPPLQITIGPCRPCSLNIFEPAINLRDG